MKTLIDIIKEVKKNSPHHLSIMINHRSISIIEKAMKIYANQKLDEAINIVSLRETNVYTTPDIDIGFNQGIEAAKESILLIKDKF